MVSYLREHLNPTVPQSEPLDDTQVKNAAGGYVYQIDILDYVKRFLVMGTEGGTYYASERELTKQNLDNVKQAIKERGLEVISMAHKVSMAGQAAKNDQAILVLALGLTHGDAATKEAVALVFNDVVRTGSHLLMAASFIDELRGWGRAPRRIVGNWYLSKSEDELAYQCVKYRNRNGWTHRDVLMRVRKGENSALYRWIAGIESLHTPRSVERRDGGAAWYAHTDDPVTGEPTRTPKLINGFEAVQHMGKGYGQQAENIVRPENVAQMIKEYKLTHEMIPTVFLKEPVVWEALLEDIPLGALLRNLGRITSLGMMEQMSDLSKEVCEKFTPSRVRKARLHPLSILTALKIYEQGKGMQGSLTWKPNSWVLNTLGEAFYWAFDGIKPVDKPILLALDVSASMFGGYYYSDGGPMKNSPLTCGEIAAVMAMVSARVEKYHHICAFDRSFVEMPITAQMRLTDVMEVVRNRDFGGTDCSLPMRAALKYGWHNIEGFVIYTDNETWAGNMHPKEALEIYRAKTGLESRLAVSAMTATNTSITDSKVPWMCDFVGFSTDTPRMISQFIGREF